MIEIKDKTKCCGCTACVSICPKNCITMQYDEEGFLYPVVDSDSCVNCSLCEKACPMVSVESNKAEESIYAAVQYLDEKKRRESTAGGVFSLIADKLIEDGAVVYAVGYDSNKVVCHKCAKTATDLTGLRGSKYVQSYLGDTFNTLDADLKAGLTVLFVGTPCQVAGLKKRIHDTDKLYTIDLLCLGVSSPKLFEKYISYLEQKYNKRVSAVQFRNKHYGYATPNVRVCFEDGKYIQQTYDSKVHANLFFSHYNVRPCCYECQFREQPRLSDFTIGDFPDIGNYSSKLDDNKGTTRAWIHTEKGRCLMEKLRGGGINYMIVSENVINVVGGKKKQINCPENRNTFFSDAQHLTYEELIQKWQPYEVKGTVISIIRNIINITPFRDSITRKIRLKNKKKFHKNSKKLNQNND